MDLSTGFHTKLLTSGLLTMFTAPVLQFRTGSPPANANTLATGDLICEVTLPTSGYFGTPASGTAPLAGSWTGIAQAAGTIGWFRLKNDADTNITSTTLARIDGTVTVSAGGGDIELSAVVLALFDDVTITAFPVTSQDA